MADRRARPPRSARRVAAVALGLSIVLGPGLAACSDDAPKDPAEARLDRVEARLRDSFSARQATCILEQLDDPVIRALDKKADLTADSPALARYTAALDVCVTGGTTTTTSTPPTTTEPASGGG